MQKSKSKAEAAGFVPARPANIRLRSVAARTVGELVPALMRPAFEKYGFPAAAILTDWPAIAGPDLARFTSPERLKWPRRSAEDSRGETGAILMLRVSGARALEVDHSRDGLIERINAAFGYRAVTGIRLIQAPLPRSDKNKPLTPVALPPVYGDLLADLPEDRLKQAFSRMASGLKRRDPAPESASV